MMVEFADVSLRLVAAAVAGGVLGINRDIERKPIGIRTLALVALGAALVTIATIEVDGIFENKDALSRVVQGLIQGIMAGIGFIGAGVILRRPDIQIVKGLTTAATVWVTAALGIACGLGAWDVVLAGMVIAVIILVGVKWLLAALHLDTD